MNKNKHLLKWIIMFIIMIILEKHIYGVTCFFITLLMTTIACFLCEHGFTKGCKTKKAKKLAAFFGFIIYYGISLFLLVTCSEVPSITMDELDTLQANVMVSGMMFAGTGVVVSILKTE